MSLPKMDGKRHPCPYKGELLRDSETKCDKDYLSPIMMLRHICWEHHVAPPEAPRIITIAWIQQ